MNEELYFLYSEYLEYSRLFHWYQGSEFSFFKGKTSKVEAERCRYLSNYYWEQVVAKARSMMVPKR
jgi:hypothetical protein